MVQRRWREKAATACGAAMILAIRSAAQEQGSGRVGSPMAAVTDFGRTDFAHLGSQAGNPLWARWAGR